MQTLVDFIAGQRGLVEELEKQASVAYWNASLSGSKDDELKASALSTELTMQYASSERLQFLLSTPIPSDHDLRRQRQLLIDGYRAHQSPPAIIDEITSREMEIESLFSNFRAKFRGRSATDNELDAIFRESNDAELRQEAWEASKQIGAVVSGKVLDLVRLRNSEAKRLGFKNYYAMSIELQELDEDQLFELLDRVSRSITPQFTEYKAELDAGLAARFQIAESELRPWHYSNPFFQDAPNSEDFSLDGYFEGKDLEAIAESFFARIGFDIRRLLTLADLYEKPGKMQHAYCTVIGRGTHDIRVLCNLVPNARWMATLLHEFGHAVYDDLIDDDLPFFLQGCAHTMTTEAIAELMGRFVNNGAWLRAYAGVNDEEAARVERASNKTNRAHLLIFTQWVLVMAHFERELYLDPEQDLDTLWWDLVERFQHLHRPSGPRHSDWAAKIHISTSPVYYHNYLLGEMTASQILSTLTTKVVASDDELVTSPKVGIWLTENIFKPGARYSWNALLEKATGEVLNPDYFIQELIPAND